MQSKRRARETLTLAAVRTAVTPRHAIVVRGITLIAALALAACSAGMSITGLTAIFVGVRPIIGMGTAFELGKLSAAAWLGRRHGGGRLCLDSLLTHRT